jgi:hypothetical protein
MGFILLKFTPEQLAQVQQLSTTTGFADAFHSNVPQSRTFREAYEVTESTHEEVFGRRKFSCYQSFQYCLKYELRKK